jgi:hypothetical protein
MFGALVGIAALLTAAAVRASGGRRALLAVAAALAWLVTARSVSVGALMTVLARSEGDSLPPPD